MAAPTYGAAGTFYEVFGTTSAAFPVPSGVAANSLIVIVAYLDGTSDPGITLPSGFSHAEGSPVYLPNGTQNHRLLVAWKRATGADSGTYTVTLTSSIYVSGQAHRYEGVVTGGTPFDSPTSAAGSVTNSTTSPTVSITTAGADRLLLHAADSWAGGTWTAPTSYTKRQQNATGSATLSDLAQAVAGSSGSITATVTGSDKMQAWLGALIPASSGPVDTPIRPTYVADRGSAADATAGTTTAVTVTSPTTVAVGNYLIARVAVDNSGSSGAAPGCTVTDPRSNTWTVLGPGLADPGAASAGSTAYLCYAKVTTAYQAADTLTFNWGGISTTAKAIVVEEWSYIHSTNPIAVASTTNDSGTAGSTTAVTLSRTPTGVDQLVYTCLATEGIAGDTVGTDSDTTNGSWAVLTTTASANATATNNQRVSGAYKVVTAAGAQSWDSTITSRDWAAVAVVFNPPDLPPPLTKIIDGALVRSHYW